MSEGAELLHVVDLDAALGRGENFNVIKRIVRDVPIKMQLGGGLSPLIVSGGVSSLSDLMWLDRMGVYGVIVGIALYELCLVQRLFCVLTLS